MVHALHQEGSLSYLPLLCTPCDRHHPRPVGRAGDVCTLLRALDGEGKRLVAIVVTKARSTQRLLDEAIDITSRAFYAAFDNAQYKAVTRSND